MSGACGKGLKCLICDRLRRELFSKIAAADFLTWDDDMKLTFLTCNSQIVKSTAQFLINAYNLRSTKL